MKKLSINLKIIKQKGAILFVSLMVLLVLAISAVLIARSSDSAVSTTGMLSFKKTSLDVGDSGIDAATKWLITNHSSGHLDLTDTGQGYFSSIPSGEPDWTDPANWQTSKQLPVDNLGNTVSYIIHRMCTQPDTPYNGTRNGVANICASAKPAAGSALGNSMGFNSIQFEGTPRIMYRITVKIDGPKNSTSLVQTMVAISV